MLDAKQSMNISILSEFTELIEKIFKTREPNLYSNRSDKVFKNGPSKFFKGCLSQILFGPFSYTLSHIKGGILTNKHYA